MIGVLPIEHNSLGAQKMSTPQFNNNPTLKIPLLTVFACFALVTLLSCNNAEFSGTAKRFSPGSNASLPPNADLRGKGDAGEEYFKDREVDFEKSDDIEISDGDLCIIQTGKGDGKQKEIGQSEGAGGGKGAIALGQFVNTRCNTNIRVSGSIYADQASADILCELYGFQKAQRFWQGSYTSPKNNQIAVFEPNTGDSDVIGSSGTFKIYLALLKNRYILGATCVNTLPESCIEKLKGKKFECR
jgi:hypothetical protein